MLKEFSKNIKELQESFKKLTVTYISMKNDSETIKETIGNKK